jgi:putative transposase
MCHPKRRCNCSESLNERFDIGKQTERSVQLELHLGIAGTTLKHTCEVKGRTIESPSSIPELVVTNNAQISNDKSVISNPNSRKGKRSKKSVVGLTSAERGFLPFWDESCQEMSDRWWSVTKIGLPDLESNLSDGFVSKMLANSWFSVAQTSHQNEKWLKMFWQSSTSSVAASTDCVSTNLKSRKIRIYPSSELSKVWRTWIAAARWCFNKAIAVLKTGKIGKYDLRKMVMDDVPDWVNNTPYNPRQLAIFQAFEAHKAAKKSGGAAKFRSVREPAKSIRFQKDNWKNGTFYPSLTKNLDFKSTEIIPDVMEFEPILSLDRGRWFVCFASRMEIKPSNSNRVLAIDPGVRTFCTGFDGSKFIEVGNGDIGRIQRLCKHLDDLMSKIGNSKGHLFKHLRYKLRKASERIRVKIRNLIDELHHKLAAHLTSSYGLIFLPTFETSQMVLKSTRKLRSKTARNMLTWSHYRFKQTLKHHAIKRGCIVVDVTEEYTSKTCSKCGQVHSKLGGNKTFKCPNPECNHIMDRDKNGAFNILLKALRDTSKSSDLLYSVNFG